MSDIIHWIARLMICGSRLCTHDFP
jgi:hypothetical protein